LWMRLHAGGDAGVVNSLAALVLQRPVVGWIISASALNCNINALHEALVAGGRTCISDGPARWCTCFKCYKNILREGGERVQTAVAGAGDAGDEGRVVTEEHDGLELHPVLAHRDAVPA
jgi:hypothetical protein